MLFSLNRISVSFCRSEKSKNSSFIHCSIISKWSKTFILISKQNYGASPDFFVRTLDEIMHPAFDRDSTDDVRLVPTWWCVRCLSFVVAPSTADLSASRRKSVHSSFLFEDLVRWPADCLSSRELPSLAMGCHFKSEQRQVDDEKSTERVEWCFFVSDWRNGGVRSFLACSFRVFPLNDVRCSWWSFSVLLEKRMTLLWSTIRLKSYNAAKSWSRTTRCQLFRRFSKHCAPSKRNFYFIISIWSRSTSLNPLYCVRMFWLRSPNIFRWMTPSMRSRWVFFQCFAADILQSAFAKSLETVCWVDSSASSSETSRFAPYQ